MKTYLMIVGMLVVLFAASDVSANIAGVTIDDYSSAYMGDNRHPDTLVDGSGLDINGPDTHSSSAGSNMWQHDAGAPEDQYVVFDLGAVYEPNAIKVWNYNEAGNTGPNFGNQEYYQASGTKDVLLRGSATLPAGNDWDLMPVVGTYQIEMAPGDDTTAFGTVCDVNDPVPGVRYLLLDVESSWDDGSGYPWVGLSEVRFIGLPVAFGPPDVNAGADTSSWLTAGSCVVDLDGTVINPPGAPAETTLWTVISGPGAVVFDDDSQVDTTATFTVTGSYVLQLEADNTYVATDTVSIEVYANACDAAKAEPGYTLIPGDIDEDCYVKLSDFSLMATHWLECNSLDIIECP